MQGVINIIFNLRFWILSGIICALIIGPIGDLTSTLIIFVLIIQMTLSLDGLYFNEKDIKDNKIPILLSLIACFGVSTIVTLLLGSVFITEHPIIWQGWIVLAAVPCAVSVVTMAFFSKGNITMCVLSIGVIYSMALVLTPLIIWLLIGESVSILKIFSYVILFVIVPIIISIPMKKVKIDRSTRVLLINIMIFFMILLSLGQNREFIIYEPLIVVSVAVVCFLRIFVVSFIVLYFLRKRGSDRKNSMVYIPMAVWKNSGLALTLCLVIFGSGSEAVIPCAVSLLIELLWFAVFSGYIEKAWPNKEVPLNS